MQELQKFIDTNNLKGSDDKNNPYQREITFQQQKNILSTFKKNEQKNTIKKIAEYWLSRAPSMRFKKITA